MAAVMNPFHPSHNNIIYPSSSSSPPSPTSSRGGSNALSSSSDADWRTRYLEVSELLNETRTELDEFTRTSKELEEELERDLERTEKAQEELRARVSKLEGERDDWKMKFMNLQHTHNQTTNSLQRELDATRQSVQLYKDQVRELEMGNDDLERNERQASSSLADVEQKYARALEEKILLEHELQDKVALEEMSQRLRDELRDVNLEVAVLKDQVTQLKTLPERPHTMHRDSSSSLPFTPPDMNEESLLRQEAPDLSLSDLALPSPSSSRPISMSSLQSRLSQELFCDDRLPASPVSVASFSSSRPNSTLCRERPTVTTTPTQTHFLQRALSPISSGASSSSTRLPTPRTRNIAPSPQPSTPVTPRIPVFRPAAQRSRGVQMVSDMRARVRTLEQKIQSNMPRIPSITGATGGAPLKRAPSRVGGGGGSASGNVRTPKRSVGPNGSAVGPKEPSSPWVLIADDGAANTTLRGEPSPEPAPRLPPVPNISPFTTAPVGRSPFDGSVSGIRPPSRTSGLRSVSSLGRPVASLASHVAAAGGSKSRPPPTAFPTSLSVVDHKDSPRPATHVNANVTPRPTSRIAHFAASSSTVPSPPRRSSEQHDRDRSTTPTFLSKPSPAVSEIFRRTHTISSPTRPKAHLTAGVVPRQRKDSQHQTKAHLATGPNTKDAGVTPGKVKPRSATSPETPPPLPSLPADVNPMGGRVHSGPSGGNALPKSRLGGSKPTSYGLPLGASRIGRPSAGASGRRSVDLDILDAEDEDMTIRVKPRSGTIGSAR